MEERPLRYGAWRCGRIHPAAGGGQGGELSVGKSPECCAYASAAIMSDVLSFIGVFLGSSAVATLTTLYWNTRKDEVFFMRKKRKSFTSRAKALIAASVAISYRVTR